MRSNQNSGRQSNNPTSGIGARQGGQFGNHNALDVLSQTIEELETRILGATTSARNETVSPAFGQPAPNQPASSQPVLGQKDNLANRIRARRHSISGQNSAQSGQAYRSQMPEMSMILSDLRQELKQDMQAALNKELGALHSEISDMRQVAIDQNEPAIIGEELEQIAKSLKSLEMGHSPYNDSEVASLRLEIDSLRNLVDQTARQDTLDSMRSQWGNIEKKLEGFNANALNNDLANFANRIEDIRHALAQMPQSRSIEALEQKVGVIATTIENLAQDNQTGLGAQDLNQLNDHIDSRLSELSDKLGSIALTSNDVLTSRIENLSNRLNDMSGPSAAYDAHFSQLEERIARLQASLETKSDAGSHIAAGQDFFPEINDRLSELHSKFDAFDGRAAAVETAGVERMIGQLADVITRLDERPVSAQIPDQLPGVERIESQLEQLTSRLEDVAQNSTSGSVTNHALGIERLEGQLSEIAARLDQSTQQSDPLNTDHLEQQISHLSNLISGSNVDQVSDKLNFLEEHLNTNDEYVLEAARQAAETALASYSAQGGAQSAENSVIHELANDLKGLNKLYKDTDQRSARAMEALQDALMKIADKLDNINTASNKKAEMPKVQHLDDAPLAAQAHAETAETRSDEKFSYSPENVSDHGIERQNISDDNVPSVEHTLDDVMDTQIQSITNDQSAMDALSHNQDNGLELDSEFADEPLEPGSGAPDINSIMQKVRDVQRSRASQKPASNAGQSTENAADPTEFIASARRAALAAAAEVKDINEKEGKTKSKTSRFKLKRKKGEKAKSDGKPLIRKPVLMAAGAVLLAIMAMPLAKNLIFGNVANTEPTSVASVEPNTIENSAPVLDTAEGQVTLETDGVAPQVRVIEPETTPQTIFDNAEPQLADQSDIVDLNRAQIDGAPALDSPALDNIEGGENIEFGADAASLETQASPIEPSLNPVADYSLAANLPDSLAPVTLRKAAENGDPLALFEIGVRYTEGRGTPVKLDEAAKWYGFAADQNFAPAQYRLANLYEKGTGVERDIERAKQLYQASAEQGNASSMHNLGVLYASTGKVADMTKAAEWFQKAADFGVRDSQVNMAILYARGDGVERNLVESYKWFAIAANEGDKDAATKRDEVFNALPQNEANTARQKVADWTPKPLNVMVNSVVIPDSWAGAPTNTASTPSVDMKKAIQNIQAILNNNGYDAGQPDGIIGKRTTAAIKNFQKDNNMEPTGQITDALVQELLVRNNLDLGAS